MKKNLYLQMLIDVNSVMLPAQGQMHLLLTLKDQDIKGYMYLCVCYTKIETTGNYTVFMLLIFSQIYIFYDNCRNSCSLIA